MVLGDVEVLKEWQVLEDVEVQIYGATYFVARQSQELKVREAAVRNESEG